jgi:hypothetical protein
MAVHTVAPRSDVAAPAAPFARLAGICGIAAGVISLLYAIAFVVLQNQLLYSASLLLSSLCGVVLMVGLYVWLRTVDEPFALLGLLFGVAGAIGAAAHGGYDLANAINPPQALPDIPFAVDPRGLLTFAITGLGVLILSWLLGRAGARWPSYLGYALGVLLVLIYLARLIVLSPASPVLLIPVLLSGFLVGPLWYVLTGVSLLRRNDKVTG